MVDSSPRPIAASHVLHRLLVPRHPPFALGNLTTKMLASTVQFSNNGQPHTHHRRHTAKPRQSRHKRGKNHPETTSPPTSGGVLVPSGLNRVFTARPSRTTRPSHHPQGGCTRRPAVARLTRQCLRQLSTPPPHSGSAGSWTTVLRQLRRGQVLLRKEVIQPHLPVRLPCYDFVPIASPTFDGSLHKG